MAVVKIKSAGSLVRLDLGTSQQRTLIVYRDQILSTEDSGPDAGTIYGIPQLEADRLLKCNQAVEQ